MSPAQIAPPIAKIDPVHLEKQGHVRTDNYYWLKERENPEVIAYLEAENAHTNALMAHTEGLQAELFKEIKGRIKQTDTTAPYRMLDYVYYTRFEDGKEYPIHCRKRETLEAPEQVLLDVNAMAEGHEFFAVSSFDVSSGQDLLAYAVDAVGRRIYSIHFKDLSTGELLEDVIPDVTSNLTWAEDNRTLFYTRQDLDTLRWYQVYRHVLGTDPAEDELVYEELDDTFGCGVSKTKSREYLLIGCRQTLATEYHVLETGDPGGPFRLFLPRERDHEYHVDHYDDHFFVRTNHQAKNFRLMKTPLSATGMEHWREVIPQRDDVLLEDFQLFRDHLVVMERKLGLVQMQVHPWSAAPAHYPDFGEPTYWATVSENHEIDTGVLRYTYTSLTTPKSVYEYDMNTRETTLIKQDKVLGGFDAADYQTERIWATAGDGTEIPLSVVYRRGVKLDGGNPTLLYGYGSYGYSMDATLVG